MAGSSTVLSHASLVGFARACSRTPAPRCQGCWAVLSTTDFFVAFQFSRDRASVYVGCTCAPHTARLSLDDYHYFLMKLAITVLLNDSVRLFLDFLDPAIQPGVMHLSQSLLHETTTSEESRLVCLGLTVSVGFAQLVPLGEQISVVCVVVIKPALAFMKCASDHARGSGVDSIPQLTPPGLHVVGVSDSLGHRHVLSISPLNEDVVQLLSASRSEVHPDRLLPRRKTADVGQDEAVFCAASQEKVIALVTAADSMGTQHPLSHPPADSVVCPDAGVEFAKDKPLVHFRHSQQEDMQVLVELGIRRVGAGHWERRRGRRRWWRIWIPEEAGAGSLVGL
ncbi:hypothetical protein SprV_0301149400 [Sparganum proliferum]